MAVVGRSWLWSDDHGEDGKLMAKMESSWRRWNAHCEGLTIMAATENHGSGLFAACPLA